MKFPVTVKYRRAEAVIYAKSEKYPYYRLAYCAVGKRIVRSFPTYSAVRKEAEDKLRELGAMIHAHYKGLATKAEAEKWFNSTPSRPANVVPLKTPAIA